MSSRLDRFVGGVSRPIVRVLVVVLLVVLFTRPAAAQDDIVLKWNEIAARTATATNPFNQARIMAITQLAVFEAVNATQGGYEPYLSPPTAAPVGASVEAAVVTAAHRVLTTYFNAPATVALLDAARDSDLSTIDDPGKAAGMEVGLSAANAMIALRSTDGSTPVTTIIPSPMSAGDYALTTGCPSSALFNWQNVTPFAIESPADFLLPAPPALGSQRYTKDYYEVKTVGARDSAYRPADRTDVARLYAATSPSFALSMATRQIAAAKGLSLSENARALALIMMGINDSLIASFYNKYHYNLWRPETGIREADDGNGKTEVDAAFLTFISTPCFPSYPSNHASGTNGGLEVMRRLFGAAGHDITITANVPALRDLAATVITKHYAQLKGIADDVDDARVYGGIHWRFDQVAGNALGRAVATEVAKNNLRPVHP